MTISFYFETKIKLEKRLFLKRFLKELNNKEGNKIKNLSFIFCSDAYLIDINRRYLNHNNFTDIITFNLNENKSEKAVGEIYISVDRIKENALKYGTTDNNELHRVIFHGILHLCGFNDKTNAQKISMRSKEDFYLKKYGFKG